MRVKVGVGVRDFVGELVEVRVLVGVGCAARGRLQPFPRTTVTPKKSAGTIPGQFESALLKSKLRVCDAPAFRAWVALGAPGRVQLTGVAELFQVPIKLLPK